MLKRHTRSLFLILPLIASAATASTLDATLVEKRKVLIDKQIAAATAAMERVRLYVLQTGDLTPTRAEVQSLFTLPASFWRNYAGSDCTNSAGLCVDNTTGGMGIFFDASAKTITITDVLGADISGMSSEEVTRFSTSEAHPTTFFRVTSDGAGAVYAADEAFRTALTLFAAASSSANIELSTVAPADTTKIWYRPNGAAGGCEVYIYNSATTQWGYRGVVGAGERRVHFIEADGFDADTVPGTLGDEAMVEEGGLWSSYMHNGTKWLSETASSTVSGPIYDAGALDCLLDRSGDPTRDYFDSEAGSTYKVTHDVLRPGQSNITFKRYSRYWQSELPLEVPDFTNGNAGAYAYTGLVTIVDDKDDLPLCSSGDMAYVKGNSGLIADTDNTVSPEYEMVCIDGVWYDAVPSLEKLVDVADPSVPTFSADLGEVMTFSTSVSAVGFWSSAGTPVSYMGLPAVQATKGDRSDLPVLTVETRLVLSASLGDEPTYMAEGIDSSYPYAAGYFKEWKYNPTAGLSINNMCDAYKTNHTDFNGNGLVYNAGVDNVARAEYGTDAYVTDDVSYPYKLAGNRHFNSVKYIYTDDLAVGALYGYCSSVETTQMWPLYITDYRTLSLLDKGLGVYGWVPDPAYGRVFWCDSGRHLVEPPAPSCALSGDESIATCPTSVADNYLCIQ